MAIVQREKLSACSSILNGEQSVQISRDDDIHIANEDLNSSLRIETLLREIV